MFAPSFAQGWRSWNLYGGKVTQDLMTNIMDGMVSRKRMVDGKPTSLCDVPMLGLERSHPVCAHACSTSVLTG